MYHDRILVDMSYVFRVVLASRADLLLNMLCYEKVKFEKLAASIGEAVAFRFKCNNNNNFKEKAVLVFEHNTFQKNRREATLDVKHLFLKILFQRQHKKKTNLTKKQKQTLACFVGRPVDELQVRNLNVFDAVDVN